MGRAKAAIIGVGGSSIERRSDRSIVAFALDAAMAALADAGIDREQIDGYIGSPKASHAAALHVDGADEISARLLAGRLGLENLSVAIDLNSAFPTEMVTTAGHLLHSGACDYLLAVRALCNLPGVRYGEVKSREAHGEEQFTAPFGYHTGGARFATRLQAYFSASGATRRDLYELVALMRRNASRNPHAIWRDKSEIALDDYLRSPLIAEPLCMLDCDMPVSGAVAFVMTRPELAAASRQPPVYVAGSANWLTADEIFERSGRDRTDIDLCQIYDGFSFLVYEWLERLGWCPPHAAWRYVRDGECEIGGELPVNTFGGALGEGRLHGAGHVREAVLQLRGQAGDRQVPGAADCLVQVGPFDYSSLLVLSNDPA
ncbi:thiolase family protein [Pigmentiphaga kullae]|uniref:thiolase family protein n=1 Tax=Pigmentiphaga kullae TaxID=151784 RepID=UPI00102C9BEC|nr:thiolase family protein [Pigmentiphaga kullae]